MRRGTDSHSPGAGYYHDSYGRMSREDEVVPSRLQEVYRDPMQYRREEHYTDVKRQHGANYGNGTATYASSGM